MAKLKGAPIGGLPKNLLQYPIPSNPAPAGSGGGSLVDGNYGDITVGGTGTTMAVNDGSVSNAKLADMPTLSIKGNNTGSTDVPLDLTVAQVKTMLDINGSIADISFTQPSASTSWTLVHGRTISPNFAFFNASNEKEYPLEDHSVVGQVTLTFFASEVHTATLPGNGTSASLRKENILSLTATQINTALGVIDIATYGQFVISLDVNITSAITFSSTPSDNTSLELKFVQGATPKTVVPLDTNKFKGSTSNPVPAPLVTATANAEDSYSFRYSSAKTKMVISGSNLGG